MVLLIAAVPLETTLLRQEISAARTLHCGSTEIISGQLSGHKVLLAHGGIGQTNMAMQLTRLLLEHTPQAVMLCGCGGAYPGSGLKIGDLALATAEIFGDTGVETASGFVPFEQLNIPQNARLTPPLQQTLTLDPKLLHLAQNCLTSARSGSFVTVNCCSGQEQLSRNLRQRTGGICENMEGAAAARVCAEFDCPLLEVRGISNPTGTHDKAHWDLPLGARIAQEAILSLFHQTATGQWP